MSKQIQTLADSLALAQREIGGAKATKENKFLKNKYADLSSVHEACSEALSKNGIAVVQIFETIETGEVFLTTSLLKGDEKISSRLPLKWIKDWHSMGSAITYARRYSLSALVGVCPEDDDGSDAMNATKKDPIVPSRKSFPTRAKKDEVKTTTEEVKEEKSLRKIIDPGVMMQEKAYAILTKVPGGKNFVQAQSSEHDPARLPIQVAKRIIDLGIDGMEKKVAEHEKELKKKIEAKKAEDEKFMNDEEKEVA